MNSEFTSSKKCPHCGQWSGWQQQLSDTCEHCGALLESEAFLRGAARDADRQKKKRFEIDIIHINPEDSGFVVFYKRIIQVLQYSFIAIVSFILWVLAMVAG